MTDSVGSHFELKGDPGSGNPVAFQLRFAKALKRGILWQWGDLTNNHTKTIGNYTPSSVIFRNGSEVAGRQNFCIVGLVAG